jgi:hypothetical protein
MQLIFSQFDELVFFISFLVNESGKYLGIIRGVSYGIWRKFDDKKIKNILDTGPIP